MKSSVAPTIVFAAVSTFTASAANLLVPSDPIRGGVLGGGFFTEGVVGTAASVNNWPAAEPPQDLINGLIGGGGEKYLNFAELNTGVVVSPAAGVSLGPIASMTLWVANDAPERDPLSYELYGSNTVNAGTAGPYAIGSFTLISSGPLALPDTRDITVDTAGFSQTVAINASSAFTTYMLVFPTVKNAATANSMQISEVQFDTIPEPGSTALAIAGAGVVVLRRRRK